MKSLGKEAPKTNGKREDCIWDVFALFYKGTRN